MVLAPGPSSRRSRRSSRPVRSTCSAPGGRRLDQRLVEELAATGASRPGRLLAAVRPLRGGRPAGHRPPRRRRAVDRATTSWAGARCPRWPSSRRWPDSFPASWATRPRRVDESFSSGPARVSAVHPAGGVPGLGGARGPAAAATTAGSPGGAGPWPCAGRWSGAPTWSRPAGGLGRGGPPPARGPLRRPAPGARSDAAGSAGVSGRRLSWRARQALHGSAAPSPRWPRWRCPSRSELDL